ncbi:hypothetical protein D3P08_16895 [Paenibacillus nanensis]|uniref:DUF3592 domain-containing protein n=1 Tax=Paenibacillus nanensis TaxID=393251 RepID=A0A3A1URI0_9BACL|nr:hypothetical protein [Paenibacillus nanensis]RIX51159.1 hypothetical protein D3P08_16895 [Paenibacillus nanensis]
MSLIAALLLVSLTPHVFADWASSFVVYDGGSYTVTDTEIPADQIGKKIGKVTRYSDREGTYRGNFSNTFAKGTPYYAIQGVSAQEQIAVKGPDGRYWAAVNAGQYPSPDVWTSPLFWVGLIVAVLAIMFAAVWWASPKKTS